MDVQKMREYVQRWIVELRSGKYAQAQGVMKKSDGCFCALGVLCNLFVNDQLGKWVLGGDQLYHPRNRFYYESPEGRIASSWLTLEHHNTFDELFGKQGVENSVTKMNDSGKTFAQIADMIEMELRTA